MGKMGIAGATTRSTLPAISQRELPQLRAEWSKNGRRSALFSLSSRCPLWKDEDLEKDEKQVLETSVDKSSASVL